MVYSVAARLGLNTCGTLRYRPQAEEIIYGQMRDVIATLTIEQINGDRTLFVEKVTEHVETELMKLGLNLINVNFTGE